MSNSSGNHHIVEGEQLFDSNAIELDIVHPPELQTNKKMPNKNPNKSASKKKVSFDLGGRDEFPEEDISSSDVLGTDPEMSDPSGELTEDFPMDRESLQHTSDSEDEEREEQRNSSAWQFTTSFSVSEGQPDADDAWWDPNLAFDLAKEIKKKIIVSRVKSCVKGRYTLTCCFFAIFSLCITTILLTYLIGRGTTSSILGRDGMVMSTNPTCSTIGLSVLSEGGSAGDAAIAISFCHSVVYPFSSGIGGGGYALVYQEGQSATSFDFAAQSPLATNANSLGFGVLRQKFGVNTVGVPGFVAGLSHIHDNVGQLPWERLVQPAVSLARTGVIVDKRLAEMLQENRWVLLDSDASQIFGRQGQLLQEGDRMFQPQLAVTLEAIALTPTAFYLGGIAQNIIDDLQPRGSVMERTDLEIYRSVVTPALETYFQGYGVLGVQPSSGGGLIVSEVLNILERYNLPKAGPVSASTHLYVEALKQSFRDISVLTNGSPNPIDGDSPLVNMTQIINTTDTNSSLPDSALFLSSFTLSSKMHAASVRPRFFTAQTFEPAYYGTPGPTIGDMERGESALVVDAFRNAVSIMTSLSSSGGARIFSRATGIVFNNALAQFRDPIAVVSNDINGTQILNLGSNFIAPLKRPLSPACPTIVLRDGEFFMAVAATPTPFSGSSMITATLEAILDTVAFDFELEQAISRFRIHHQLQPNAIFVERGYPTTLRSALSDRGHNVTVLPSGTRLGELAIVLAHIDGTLRAVSDSAEPVPFDLLTLQPSP